MVDKYKKIINNNIDILLNLQKVKGKKTCLYKTNCIINKDHFMYYNPINHTLFCPICNYNKDLVDLSASIVGTSEEKMLIRILEKKLNIDTRELKQKYIQNKFYKKLLYKINYETMLFFEKELNNNKIAKKYLKERQITPQTINKFHLGYAPKYNYLYKYLKEKFDIKDLYNAGVVGINKKTNKAYDTFKDRIIFPIIDNNNNIVGFGGRTINPNNPKKYINTKTTELFKKSNTLYGLNFIDNDKKYENIIVCEGYMDVISLYQAGFNNVVGTLGTALTKKHCDILTQMTNNIVVIFDGDDAGIKAMDRVLKNIGKVNTVILPNNLDPDDFIKIYGKNKLKQYFEQNNINWYQYFLNKYDKRENIFKYYLQNSLNV